MFGLGLTELLVLLVVGVVVVGPKKLPEMMRTTGRWVAKLRRMSTDLRSQSGIDEILRAEGLEKEIRELRSLSRINVMDSLVNAASKPAPRALTARATTSGGAIEPPAPSAARGATSGAALPAPTTGAGVDASSAGPAPGPAGGGAEAGVPRAAALDGSRIPGSKDALRAQGVLAPPGAPPPGAIASSSPNGAVARPASVSASASASVGAMRAGPVALPGDEPLPEREWPPWGCDAYDALPDDLDEEEVGTAPDGASPPGSPVAAGADDAAPAAGERIEPGAA